MEKLEIMKNLNLVLAAILISVSVFSQQLNKEAQTLSNENKKAFQAIIEIVKSKNDGNLNFEDVNEQANARASVSRFKQIKNDELFAVIEINSLTPQQFETKFEAMQAPTNWVIVHKELKTVELERLIAKMDTQDKKIFSGKKHNETADIITGAGFGLVIVGSAAAAPAVAVVGSIGMFTGWVISRAAAHKTSNAIIEMME